MDILTVLDVTYQVTLTKIVVAVILGGMVGLERDLTGHAAGLRTCMMIALASCLFTELSVLFEPGDWRIAPQIVTGVGFLGAGAVLHQKDQVLGLTTAAVVWLVAAIGMTVGAGLYSVATATTILSLLLLELLSPARSWMQGPAAIKTRHQRAARVRPTAAVVRVRKASFKSMKMRDDNGH